VRVCIEKEGRVAGQMASAGESFVSFPRVFIKSVCSMPNGADQSMSAPRPFDVQRVA
jgi:hypothetical protein